MNCKGSCKVSLMCSGGGLSRIDHGVLQSFGNYLFVLKDEASYLYTYTSLFLFTLRSLYHLYPCTLMPYTFIPFVQKCIP